MPAHGPNWIPSVTNSRRGRSCLPDAWLPGEQQNACSKQAGDLEQLEDDIRVVPARARHVLAGEDSGRPAGQAGPHHNELDREGRDRRRPGGGVGCGR